MKPDITQMIRNAFWYLKNESITLAEREKIEGFISVMRSLKLDEGFTGENNEYLQKT